MRALAALLLGLVALVGTPPVTGSAQHPLGDLAPTPPMGWNSWNTFGCDVSARLVEQTVDAMVRDGMRAALETGQSWTSFAAHPTGHGP